MIEHASDTIIPFCPKRTDAQEDAGASDFLMVGLYIILSNKQDHCICYQNDSLLHFSTGSVVADRDIFKSAQSNWGLQRHHRRCEGGSQVDGTYTGKQFLS